MDTQEIVKRLAKTNLRGVTSSVIVCEIQSIRDELEREPGESRLYLLSRFNYLLNELERRSRMNTNGVRTTNKEIIQTIKEKIRIEDVISWYTQVFTEKRVWTFRCTLHGKDKNPSGVIYPKEGRFHCFTCQAHGDIFDAVQLWERMELIDAIKKLATFVGLEIKPFEKKPTDPDERLRQVELKVNHLLTQPVGATKRDII